MAASLAAARYDGCSDGFDGCSELRMASIAASLAGSLAAASYDGCSDGCSELRTVSMASSLAAASYDGCYVSCDAAAGCGGATVASTTGYDGCCGWCDGCFEATIAMIGGVLDNTGHGSYGSGMIGLIMQKSEINMGIPLALRATIITVMATVVVRAMMAVMWLGWHVLLWH